MFSNYKKQFKDQYKKQFELLNISLEDEETIINITHQYKLTHCQTQRKNIIASAVYVLFVMNKDHKSMKSIAEIFNTTEYVISKHYKSIARIWGRDLHFY